MHTDVQRQTAVTAYFKSKQLLLFAFAGYHTATYSIGLTLAQNLQNLTLLRSIINILLSVPSNILLCHSVLCFDILCAGNWYGLDYGRCELSLPAGSAIAILWPNIGPESDTLAHYQTNVSVV